MEETKIENRSVGEFKSIANLVLTAVGVGVLALPSAITHSGWAIGIVILLLTWALSQAMMHLLWKCIMAVSASGTVRISSYGDVGAAALGKAGRYAVAFATYSGLSAICVLILILLGSGLHDLTDTLSKAAWIRIAALCILPLSWLPSLKEVGILSTIGVLAVSIVGIVVLVASISTPSANRDTLSAFPTGIDGLAMAFLEFMNSFTIAPVIPTIILGMSNPLRFPRVSAYAFAIITLCFGVIGFA